MDYAVLLVFPCQGIVVLTLSKVYICIFVCLTVKAVHMELVSELSSESFVAAFSRFVAAVIITATNFVSVNSQLPEHLGPDGHISVVTVRTQSGLFK